MLVSHAHPLLPAGLPWFAFWIREGHTNAVQQTKSTSQSTSISNTLHIYMVGRAEQAEQHTVSKLLGDIYHKLPFLLKL